LQGVLELLYCTLQAQAASISDLQARVAGLDSQTAALGAWRAGADERSGHANNNIHVLNTRLEMQAADAAAHAQQTSTRLQQVALQVQRATNLAGRQAALDDIASMLGVAVPAPEPVSASCKLDGGPNPSWVSIRGTF
jgi:hypothetical protein